MQSAFNDQLKLYNIVLEGEAEEFYTKANYKLLGTELLNLHPHVFITNYLKHYIHTKIDRIGVII